MKFEIGQIVYSAKKYFRNLEVLGYRKKESEVICKGEQWHENNKNFTKGWHKDDYISFHVWELKDTPFDDNIKELRQESKWDKIIKRTPTMSTSLSYMYEDYLTGELILDTPYQRGFVWSLKQKQEYIKALFEDKASISPTIILNWSAIDRVGRYECIDGKQRLSTVFDFMTNKFPLENGIYMKDLNPKDFNFIIGHKVNYTRIEKWNQTDLTLQEKIELFLEINALGTKMSDEHIEKVKEMIK